MDQAKSPFVVHGFLLVALCFLYIAVLLFCDVGLLLADSGTTLTDESSTFISVVCGSTNSPSEQRKQSHSSPSHQRKEQSQHAQTEAKQAHIPKIRRIINSLTTSESGQKTSNTSLSKRFRQILLLFISAFRTCSSHSRSLRISLSFCL